MASGIRLPGVLGSSWLIFLLYLRPRLARPFGPRFHRCFGVSSRSACQPLSLSLSLSGHLLPPHFFSSSFHPHLPPYCQSLILVRTLGLSPAGARAALPVSFLLFGPPISCHRSACFYIVPCQLSSASILQRGLCVFPYTCSIFSATASILVLQALTTELILL